MIAVNNTSKKRGLNNLRDVEKEKRNRGKFDALECTNVKTQERENSKKNKFITWIVCLTEALSVLTLAFFNGGTVSLTHVMRANFARLLNSSPVSILT